MLLAGEIRDGATVKISASHGALTFDGKAIGEAAKDEAPPAKSPTVVHFPKGA
jgi:ATP-dependent Clp protease ATP-binding subunit ClpB